MHRLLEFTAILALLGSPGYLIARSLAWRGVANVPVLELTLGMSVAGVPLLWLFASYLGWPAAHLVSGAALGVVGFTLTTVLTKKSAAPFPSPDWIAGLLFLLGAGWRLAQISGWDLPAWVDSVHHALIIRHLLESGGVPTALSPELALPFFYHFGYHSLVAIGCQVLGLSIPTAMLLVGQALQVGVLLAVYRLGKTLWPGPWAGLTTLAVLFVSPLPGRYTAWGKYPLLTATLLLPLALRAGLELVEKGITPGRTLWFSLLLMGILLTHYYAAFTLALFLMGLFLTALKKGRPAALLPGMALSLLLTAPWLWRVWASVRPLAEVQVAPDLRPETTYFAGYLPYLWQLTGPGCNRVLWLLALPGLGLALRQRRLRPLALWLASLLALALPYGWKFSLAGPDRALILWWLPASLLATETIRAASHRLRDFARAPAHKTSWLRRAGQINLWLAWVALVGWGASSSFALPPTTLAVAADLPALAWIATHTPPEARFFISVTPWPPYGYRGMDGGWWITPLTGRQTLLPPALYGLGSPAEVERLNALAGEATSIGGCGPEFWRLVAQEHLTYLYFNTAHSPLRPDGFDGCEAIEQVYAQEGVFIYRLWWPEPVIP